MKQARSSKIELQTAAVLRDLLRDLFTMSTRQMELLDQENYDALEVVLAKKGELLNALPAAIEAGSRLGWKLQDPATYPVDPRSAELITEAADFSRRLQAHERYCLSQAMARRNQIDDRISVMMNRRHAASGYTVPRTQGGRLDTAR